MIKKRIIKLYWKDRLKAWFRIRLPYRCGIVVGYRKENSNDDVTEIFKKYLLRTKGIPDMSSGRLTKQGDETYYYMECHLPFLWGCLYPVDWRVDEFVLNLREQFKGIDYAC